MNQETLSPSSEADAYDRFAQLDDLAHAHAAAAQGRTLGSAYDEALDDEA